VKLHFKDGADDSGKQRTPVFIGPGVRRDDSLGGAYGLPIIASNPVFSTLPQLIFGNASSAARTRLDAAYFAGSSSET
jgi:hypothetical protein